MRMASEIDQEKIGVVHKYFEDEFPECNIRIGYDYDRMAPKFQVFSKAEKYCAIINRAFFYNRNTEEINDWLQTYELSKTLADRANRTIIINPKGNMTNGSEIE